MTLTEFYSAVGGNYESTLENLIKDERILKYLRKFPAAEDYSCFVQAFAEGAYPEAFRYIHNLKGVSLTLGLGKLGEASSIVCEAIRHGPPASDLSAERTRLDKEYQCVMEALKELFPE